METSSGGETGLGSHTHARKSHSDNAESRMSYINYHHRTAFGTRFHFLVVRICNILEENILI